MSVGSEVAAYIKTALSLSADLYINALPKTNTANAVYETPGGPPEQGFGIVGIQYENPNVQLRFRGEPDDSETPKAVAQAAYRVMTRQAVTLGSTFYLVMQPLQAPFIMERDDLGRVV